MEKIDFTLPSEHIILKKQNARLLHYANYIEQKFRLSQLFILLGIRKHHLIKLFTCVSPKFYRTILY